MRAERFAVARCMSQSWLLSCSFSSSKPPTLGGSARLCWHVLQRLLRASSLLPHEKKIRTGCSLVGGSGSMALRSRAAGRELRVTGGAVLDLWSAAVAGRSGLEDRVDERVRHERRM